MIPVTWRTRFEGPFYGHKAFVETEATIPRVPTVGEYVEDEKVVKVTWNERMDRVTVELEGES